MRGSFIKNRSHCLFVLLGTTLFLVAWGMLSLRYKPVLLPSPLETLHALGGLILDGELARHLLISLRRLAAGLALAVVVGTALGLPAGIFRSIEALLVPITAILLSSPAIVFIVLAMVWFGLTSTMVVFIIVLLVSPIMYVNTVEGIRSIDGKLREMAAVFRVPPVVRLRKIYLPGFVHHFLSGFSISAGFAVRLTVMAELLGARDGVGQSIAVSRSYLETDKLFAWIIVLVMLMLLLEAVVLRPLRKLSDRYKGLEKSRI